MLVVDEVVGEYDVCVVDFVVKWLVFGYYDIVVDGLGCVMWCLYFCCDILFFVEYFFVVVCW